MYEYEIGLEYDVQKDGLIAGKKDIFSGTIWLPKIMGYQGSKNLIFGQFEIGDSRKNRIDDQMGLKTNIDRIERRAFTPVKAILNNN